MDTVSMLNKMSFYCQPILPLVYDESMSYYETLCKVVGQLNTTGDAVNKLNEGLTGEIADRQAADAALDTRIKQIEETNRKIHFLKIDTVGNLLTPDVTRENLSQWIQDGDLIAMLYAPDELENLWAVATNYRCLGAAGADSMQLSFYVPISITNNAGKSGEDVAQEVVVISLPVGALTNQWTVRSVTSTIPNTNADGFVNLMATVGDAGAVTCDVAPGAIVDALRNYFSGTNQYAVAVNARLTYDGKQYHSASAIVKADASGSGNIRIEFENYYNGVRTENGVRQMNTETIFLVGDASTNAWSVETIDHKTFDFSRYDGFQFTRGAGNVITDNDESTPNAVYAQYHSDTSGKLYQNLPVRLIDTVDNAEYWNGVFDIKDNKHMTFTFVTSNYVAASGKMTVRVIELSADVNTTTWKYAEKEFTLPLTGGGSTDAVLYTQQTLTDEQKKQARHNIDAAIDDFQVNVTIQDFPTCTLDKTFNQILEAIIKGKRVFACLNNNDGELHIFELLRISSVEIQFTSFDYNVSFNLAQTYKLVVRPDKSEIAAGDAIMLNQDNSMNQVAMAASPSSDMEIATKKYVDDHGAANAVLYTAQSLTFEQKQRARKNIDAASSVVPTITGGVSLCPSNVTDSNTAVHTTTTTASGDDFTLTLDGGPENAPVRVKGIRTPTATENDAAANVEYVKNSIPAALKNPNALTINLGGTTVVYDGSEAKTVEIANGNEVSY